MAVIVVEPNLWSAVARPFEPGALLIVAIEVSDELQVTTVVMSLLLLSEYIPIAVNCMVSPKCAIGLWGVTFIETRVTVVTVIVVCPAIFPNVAFIEVVPPESEVAKPWDPTVLLIVAIEGTEELHVTKEVRS